jgi:hypothetical protein
MRVQGASPKVIVTAAVIVAAVVFGITQGMFRTWVGSDYFFCALGVGFALLVAAAVKYLLVGGRKRAAERAELEQLRAAARRHDAPSV